MNLVIGKSIKIETTVDIESSAFSAAFLDQNNLYDFLFKNQENTKLVECTDFNTEIKVGDSGLILQGDGISVETHVSRLSNNQSNLTISIDLYDEKLCANSIINNIISNQDFITSNF